MRDLRLLDCGFLAIIHFRAFKIFTTINLSICIVVYLRPCDRNMRDVELIACRLRRVEPLCRLTNSALQQLAICCFYEDLEKGVTREWIRDNCGFSLPPRVRTNWILNFKFSKRRRQCFVLESKANSGMLCSEVSLKFAIMQQQMMMERWGWNLCMTMSECQLKKQIEKCFFVFHIRIRFSVISVLCQDDSEKLKYDRMLNLNLLFKQSKFNFFLRPKPCSSERINCETFLIFSFFGWKTSQTSQSGFKFHKFP